ncbi:MAG TPA: LCP family protein [Nocardioides sp.]|jgi:LCP family protein required for cell wall assembly
MTRTLRSTLRSALRTILLAGVLAVTGLVVPDAAVQPTEVTLTDVRRAHEVPLNDHVIWILAVGSDARPGQDMNRSRGDALQLVGINTRTHAATAIGVPRDSWVSVPGHGFNKINTALYYGGPSAMRDAMANLVGIRADYVMVTRFPFFEDLVNDIGGIEVGNPRFFSDPNLKKEGFKAGRIHLDGYGAMAFSRIRKGLPGGDFDRSANQQRTLRGIHAKIRARADEPGFVEQGVFSVLQHMGTSTGPAQLYRIAQAAAAVEPGKITTCVIGGGVGYVGAQSVVFPNRTQARRLGDEARRDATLRGC